MDRSKYNSISKEDFKKLNEQDVLFITNPGRMGDEDGSTFVIKNGNELTIYRVDGWMYPKRGIDPKEQITLSDAKNQFPKWNDAWKNGDNDKYKYLHLGFGNGLSIDKEIYTEYEPYLNSEVEKHLEGKDNGEDIRNATIYAVWKNALEEMAKDKQLILK